MQIDWRGASVFQSNYSGDETSKATIQAMKIPCYFLAQIGLQKACFSSKEAAVFR